jgi:hypothetical protein
MIAAITALVPEVMSQRFIPGAGEWTVAASGPLASGGAVGGQINATGSLTTGATSDQGCFLRRSVGEGDEVRACIATRSSTGVAGVMVRDSEAPSSPFVFAGIDASGDTVVFYRHRAGDPVKYLEYGAAGNDRWFRLVVGRDTVYAFIASAATEALPGAWEFLGAFRIDLPATTFQTRRSDLGGFFVDQGTATFSDLVQTEALFWNEPTTTTTAAGVLQQPLASWTARSPALGSGALGATVLWRNGARGSATVDLPITTPTAGEYYVYLHCLAGNPLQMRAALVVGGVEQPFVNLANNPPGHSSWLLLGAHTTTAGAGQTFRVRISDTGFGSQILGCVRKPKKGLTSPCTIVRVCYGLGWKTSESTRRTPPTPSG